MTAGREEALRLDAYLEERPAQRPSLLPAADALDPDLRRAVDALRAGIVRIHPSFRFVEELAARLRREADALGAGHVIAGAPSGDLVAFRGGHKPAAVAARAHRGMLVRGAISGVSLAGVAFVALRLGRVGSAGRRSGPFGSLSLPGGRA